MVLRGRGLVLLIGGAAMAVASPLAFTLGSAGVGDEVSASIIAATAVAALAVSFWPSRPEGSEPGNREPDGSVARDTGLARAEGGGRANSGIRRARDASGPMRAEHTGSAISIGPDSSANSGVTEAE